MKVIGNTAILDRVLSPAGHEMTNEVARWLVDLRADPELQARFDELAEKNTEGMISQEELNEYDEYLQVSSLIAVLQAKARAVLSNANGH
jgi:hypothetical protein